MPRHWTDQQRQAHAAFMQQLHRARPFRYFRLSDQTRDAVAAALRQTTKPNASHIARQLGVSPSFVCTVARAEGIELRSGRPYPPKAA